MSRNKLFIVALHVKSPEQAINEARKILTQEGAHGVILVNNGFKVTSDSVPTLAKVALDIKAEHPGFMVGINPLDLETVDAINFMPKPLDMLWTDIGGIVEDDRTAYLRRDLKKPLEELGPEYWGSELFKVGNPPHDPQAVAMAAAEHFDVFVTSGTATGVAPDPEKIREIRAWIGPEPRLGIASGVSSENLHTFIQDADVFIVATSLCINDGKGDDFWYYDPEKVVAFRAELERLSA